MSETPELIDIGANLTHESFQRDRDVVLKRAADAGVHTLMVTGASRSGSQQALELALQYPERLWCTAGVHPHHASEYSDECDSELASLLSHPRVLAAGETGLDYHRDFSPRPQQIYAYERQLELAVSSGKPLFLHQRDAHDDFVAVLKTRRDAISRAVVHCFTGTRDELFACLDMDLYIGITGWICDERRGGHLRELVRSIPANRLMLETDAPYLMPRNLDPMPRDRRNEPMYLAHICREVARDRGESFDQTAAASVATAREFFDLPGV